MKESRALRYGLGKKAFNLERTPNTALQTDERRATVCGFCNMALAPLAAHRQVVRARQRIDSGAVMQKGGDAWKELR
jgi:hypothetical protein